MLGTTSKSKKSWRGDGALVARNALQMMTWRSFVVVVVVVVVVVLVLGCCVQRFSCC